MDTTKTILLGEGELSFHESLLNQVHNGVIVISLDNTIRYWNHYAEVLYQWKSEEVIGKDIVELLSPEEMKETVYKNLSDLNRDGHWEGEFNVRRKDGSTIYAHIINTFLKDNQGNNIGIIGINTDISERKKLEEKILFQAKLLDSVRDSIVATDMDGFVTYWSKGAEELYGYSSQEVLAKHITFIVEPGAKNEEEARMKQVVEKGSWSGQYLQKRRDGKLFWADAVISLIKDETGVPIGLVGADRDISKLKKVEEELKEANETKDRFFSIISHDLKNAFHSIISGANFLNKKDKPEQEEVKFLTKAIHNSAENQLKLLENLLEWAQVQNERMQLNPEKNPLATIVAHELAKVVKEAEAKHISLESTISEDVKVYADSQMLLTILRNLIHNSIKFTKSGGKIQVSARILDSMVEVSVCDTGVGIPKKDLSEIFRLDSSYHTRGTNGERGTGMGLILCKEFVEKNGGKIWIESEEGEGTTVRFTLPGKK